jgi:hypothetical protein
MDARKSFAYNQQLRFIFETGIRPILPKPREEKKMYRGVYMYRQTHQLCLTVHIHTY